MHGQSDLCVWPCSMWFYRRFPLTECRMVGWDCVNELHEFIYKALHIHFTADAQLFTIKKKHILHILNFVLDIVDTGHLAIQIN